MQTDDIHPFGEKIRIARPVSQVRRVHITAQLLRLPETFFKFLLIGEFIPGRVAPLAPPSCVTARTGLSPELLLRSLNVSLGGFSERFPEGMIVYDKFTPLYDPQKYELSIFIIHFFCVVTFFTCVVAFFQLRCGFLFLRCDFFICVYRFLYLRCAFFYLRCDFFICVVTFFTCVVTFLLVLSYVYMRCEYICMCCDFISFAFTFF